MKTICLLSAMILLSFSAFAQSFDQGSYDDLMARSRRARTTATIMVSTGPVVAAGGIGTLIYGLIKNAEGEFDWYYDANGNYVEGSQKKYTTEIVVGATATLLGLGVALGSIAFTNKADDLRREAKRMKLKASTDRFNIPGLQNSFANTRVTQLKLSLVVPLGN